MAVIASSEFVSLCQAQLQLLTQQMSTASAAVYITDYSADIAGAGSATARNRRPRNEPNFVPVVSYPESVESWIEQFERASAWRETPGRQRRRLLPGTRAAETATTDTPPETAPETPEPNVQEVESPQREENRSWPDVLNPDHQLVVPLMYSEVVVGLMVTIRRDRAWKSEERHYVEGVAQSLAAGCVLERRTQWLQSQIADKRDLQSRQSEIFHNLLHQFRNPLTAVTTFGQLLVRRLEPEDPIQKFATGIVRDSKRLRDMVAHFDETVALGDADLKAAPSGPLLLPGEPHASRDESISPAGLLPESAASNSDRSDHGKRLSALHESTDSSAGDELSPAYVGAGLGHALTLSTQYLPDIVEPALAVANIVATEKGVSIHTQIAPDTPSVWGEEEALGEVVSNLVDNAVKYSPPGACVWVQTGVSRMSDTTHYQGIVVGDTGPGIPSDDLTRLFERHYRGVQAEGDIPGTGLGLAIAQSLMVQMHGSIEVISPAIGTPWMPQQAFEQETSVGPGTVFILWLQEVERPG